MQTRLRHGVQVGVRANSLPPACLALDVMLELPSTSSSARPMRILLNERSISTPILVELH